MLIFKKYRFVIIVLLIALTGFFLPLKFLAPVKNYIWQGLRPAGAITRVVFGSTFPFFSDIAHLRSIISENNNLVKENLDLKSKLAKLLETSYENEILKKELGFMKNQDLTKIIPAAIIGQSSGYLKSVVVDKGESAGVKKGDAVISQGVLVGVVTDVRQDNSEITLITDFNSLVPAVLQNSRGTGLLRGGLSGLVVEEIPLNITIQKGENVVTSNLNGQIPAGILIGKVGEVISKEGEIFQQVSVSSLVDFSRLEVLFIEIKP